MSKIEDYPGGTQDRFKAHWDARKRAEFRAARISLHIEESKATY
jgi:hypothetical protein